MSTIPRPSLLLYNTVERLLRGDFFHCIDIDRMREDLATFPGEWPVIGLGTSNWYQRNGELIIAGQAERPNYFWGDPYSSPQPGALFDLTESIPEPDQGLTTPMEGQQTDRPNFPFAAIGVCPPDDRQDWQLPANTSIHEWIESTLMEENVGLAAVHVEGSLEEVEYTTMCHIPVGGLDLSEGYVGEDAFRFGRLNRERWELRGLFAANPTIQSMISVQGHPFHLHGFAPQPALGGHVNVARSRRPVTASVWPLKDLVLRIRDLDLVWLPMRDLKSDPEAG